MLDLEQSIPRLLRESAPWVFEELEFRVVHDEPVLIRSFGNTYCILENALIGLKFTRDRGEVFLEIAFTTDRSHWWQLSDVFAVLVGVERVPDRSIIGITTDLRKIYKLLIGRIEASEHEVKSAIQVREAERAASNLRRYQAPLDAE